jgi:hypothetical protein
MPNAKRQTPNAKRQTRNEASHFHHKENIHELA